MSKHRAAHIPTRRRRIVFPRLAERDRWICWLCGNPIEPTLPRWDEQAGSIDHVVPRSRGGRNGQGNLRLAHRGCNTRRGNAALPDRKLAA